jgi:hypothetical protein
MRLVIQVIYVGWLSWTLRRGGKKINLAGANEKKWTKTAFVRVTLFYRRSWKSSSDKINGSFQGYNTAFRRKVERYERWIQLALSRATLGFAHRKKI